MKTKILFVLGLLVGAIIGFSLDALVIFLFYLLWNYIFSTQINQFLFGVDKLPLLKGLVVALIVYLAVMPKLLAGFSKKPSDAIVNNNKQKIGE